jgi:hypothetical protein
MIRNGLVAILVLFIIHSVAHGYDPNTVHKKINEKATASSSVKGTIKRNLYPEGVEKELAGKKIINWINEGGRAEDDPEPRGLWHFHDPLKSWDSAGLFGTFISSIFWSQDQMRNGMTWQTARLSYYTGLTATDKQTREENMAKAFKAVGQVMHLVSDMAVPAHTRDDAHPFNEPYEKWTAAHVNLLDSYDYNAFKVLPDIFNYAIQNQSAPVPISALWDLNRYDGSLSTVYTTGYVGLAEITNANFLSEGTIFRNYPHPAKVNTNAASVEVQARDGLVDRVWYINGYNSNKLAAFTYLSPDLENFGMPIGRYYLDDNVHEEYAKRLIPLAVGYSAALLDYFFRGNIDISLSDKDVYAVTDDNDGTGFTNITLNALNTTSSGDEMPDGDISIVVKYKVAQSDPFQNQPVTKSEFNYIVIPESTGVRAIPKDNPVKLTFDLSGNAIPIWATDVYLQIVYKGKLGAEDGAVAVGYQDISEPTPFDFINLPKVCLNGAWVEHNSQAAIDYGGDIVYTHDFRDIYIKISSALTPEDQRYVTRNNYTHYMDYLAYGQYKRIYILAEKGFYASVMNTWIPTDPNDPYPAFVSPDDLGYQYYYQYNSVVNQASSAQDCCNMPGMPPHCGMSSDPGCCENVYAGGCNISPTLNLFMGVYRWAPLRNYSKTDPNINCSMDNY